MSLSVAKSLDFQYLNASRIIFGVNAASNIGGVLKDFDASKVLFVTDKGIVKSGILDRITTSVESAFKYFVFDEVEENPSVECVEKCARAISENNCDTVVAVGGGSSIDTAKMASVLATNKGKVKDYAGVNKIPNPPLPLIAVPTTAGTGSEVSPFAIITDRETGVKLTIGSSLISPKVAVLDPSLLATLPKRVAATTAMDALAHNLEYYLSKSSVPPSEALNLYAIQMIGANIRQFVADSSNLDAAGNMIMASMIGEVSFGYARLTICHAMSLPPTSHLNIPHGEAVAILLPDTMDFNLIACPGKLANVARALGENTEGLSANKAAGLAVDAVRSISKELRIPRGFGELGMKDVHIESFARDVVNSGMLRTNPRRAEFEDVVEIYKKLL